MPPLAFSHNPDDLVDWIWVILSFGFLAVFVAAIGWIFWRWANARRRARSPRERH